MSKKVSTPSCVTSFMNVPMPTIVRPALATSGYAKFVKTTKPRVANLFHKQGKIMNRMTIKVSSRINFSF